MSELRAPSPRNVTTWRSALAVLGIAVLLASTPLSGARA